MSVPFVQSNQVTKVNGNEYGFPNNATGTVVSIPVDGTQIIGSYWRIPQSMGSRFIGYEYQVAVETSSPPTPDSLKILRVKLTGEGGVTTVDMAITNTDNVSTSTPPCQFAYLADGSGGTLPVMPTVAIPYPILQNGPESMTGTTNNFVLPFPANPAALLYTIQGFYINGQAPTPTFAPTGITTVAGIVTYFNANYSAYGTWSATGDVLKLSSPTSAGTQALKVGMAVSLTATPYCFDLTSFSTPSAVNGIAFGSGTTIPVPAFQLTNDPVVLMNVLKKYMSVGTTFDTTSVSHKLGISTTMATPKLLNGASTVATATGAVCS